MKSYFFHSKSKIIPCVNTRDFNDFQQRLNWANVHAERLHLDVSDGIFVKNYSLKLEQMMSGEFKPWVDVHLMVENPLEVLKKQSLLIKVHRVYFHRESKVAPLELIKFCEDRKIKVGAALSVNSPVNSLKNYLKQIESVLILTVNLGETGGKFNSGPLKKIDELRELGFNGKIIVDGAIDDQTIVEVMKHNPDYIISGSYLFKDFNKADENYLKLEGLVNKTK